MDVLSEPEVRVETASVTASSSHLYYFAVLGYALVAGAGILRHEAWADEAQSWLLARDAGLLELWTRLLHYEGTTGLWQTLLHCLIGIGVPYRGMNVFSGLLGLAGTAVLVWRAPFPTAIRVTLPFTFFLCYQYVVIARSYAMLPLLLFSCAAIYNRASERPLLFATILSLLAAVSIHGMALSLVIGLTAVIESPGRVRLVRYLAGYGAVVILLVVSAWPAKDGTFVGGLNFSFDHLIEVSGRAFMNAFAGEWLSIFVVGMSFPLLWRSVGGVLFLCGSLLLCGISSIVYSQVWHDGILFLAWLFAMWISWPKPELRNTMAYKLAVASMAVAVAIQCYWTIRSVSYDWGHAYSGSRDAASGLSELVTNGTKIFAIGYSCVAIEPYFPRNIFANFDGGGTRGYWDWSRSNHVNRDSERLADLSAEMRPTYVIIGYKNEFERGVWSELVRKSGYSELRHFEGNTFWQTHVFEPESYDLFRRRSAP